MGRGSTLTCLALFLFSFQSGRAADVDPHLPNDTGLVLSINVEQLLNSPVGRKYLQRAIDNALKDNRRLQESFTFLGFNPRRDVSRVIVALSQRPEHGFVIVRGKFDREKIAKLAEQLVGDKTIRLRIHRGRDLTIYEGAASDGSPIFAAFPNDRTLLLCNDKEKLQRSKQRGEPQKEIAALIQRADDRRSAWFVALPAIADFFPVEDANKRRSLESLENLTGTLNVETGVRLDLHVASQTPQDAKTINQMVVDLKGLFKALAPNLAKEKPDLVPLLEAAGSITSSVRGNSTAITLELSAGQIEKIANNLLREK